MPVPATVNGSGLSGMPVIVREKAEYCCRVVHIVSLWLPSSKTGFGCGVGKTVMPLHVRVFDCDVCGVVLDRDVEAARNIFAVGRAERLNACGAGVGPASLEGTSGEEAGSSGNPRASTTRHAVWPRGGPRRSQRGARRCEDHR